jgi:hypothetical protein
MASFLSDLFGGASNAASDQASGIIKGLNAATGNINQGSQALQTNYSKALAPYLQNYGQDQQGVQQLMNALGLGSPQGTQAALTNIQTTPGFQATLGGGLAGVNAANAAGNSGGLSGNLLTSLQKTGANLGAQNYNNYIDRLMPFVGASAGAAGGIASGYENLGGALNTNQLNLGNLANQANIGIGNAYSGADLANQSLGMGLLGAGLSAAGGLPGIGGGLGQLGAGVTGGGVGTFGGNFGAPPTYSIFSDERLKEDIEPVGELYDGSNVYRYRYKGDETPRIGLMAQEVMQDRPEAVHEIDGWLAVDYSKATDRAAGLARFLEAA